MTASQALGGGVPRGFVALARTDDRELVAAEGEAVHEAAQRHGDAVDFGSVGFGDQDKFQWFGPGGGRPTSRGAQGQDDGGV
jgi:hypothetical protein